jgi:hypothetical protein
MSATGNVQITLAGAEEHVEVSNVMSFMTFYANNILNVFQLDCSNSRVLSHDTPKSLEDKESLVIPTDFAKPSRRFWKEPADSKKTEERDDLKADGEAPTEGRLAVVNEAYSVAEL